MNEIVNEYYRAWQEHAGDMSKVNLADDFRFTGPVAGFTDAAGFRAMAAQAGSAVRSFRVRHQFSEGDLVCSIVDWEMDPLPGVLTAAEILRVSGDRIVSGELIYDAEELRKALAGAPRAIVNTVDIKATANDVWQVLGDLAATRQWLPGVVAARVEGDLRVCTMADGQEVHEEISDYDAGRRSFRFRHLRVGLPVRDSGGTFVVSPGPAGASTVTLTTTFEPSDPASADQVSAMIEGAFGASLESLRRFVEEKLAWDAR
jgi:uncharacterized protein YndB with AHSA1/START domain